MNDRAVLCILYGDYPTNNDCNTCFFFVSFEEVKLYSHYINIHYACFMINIFEYMYAKNMLLIKISTK